MARPGTHTPDGIALVAAQSRNGIIGDNGSIPWRVRGEQKLFKTITMGGALVMGRKTWESIGRPLPGRTSIVITRQQGYAPAGALTAPDIDSALEAAASLRVPCYVIGGGEIYQQTIGRAQAIHLTTIETEVTGDVSFPPLPPGFELVREERYPSNIDYVYQLFRRPGGTNNAI